MTSILQGGHKSWYLKRLEEAVTCSNKHLPLLPLSKLPWPHPLKGYSLKTEEGTLAP
jgi:hypothetical protein